MELYVIYNYKALYPGLSGRALTDALIRECLADLPDLRVERTGKGKPFLVSGGGRADVPHISVSHSNGTFALLAAQANAGVDIQYARKVNTAGIAARVFTKEETLYAEEDGSGSRFFRLWTRKEAYSKFTGLGLEQIMRKDLVLDREDVTFIEIRLRDGCFCCICTDREGGCKPDEIQISYRE